MRQAPQYEIKLEAAFNPCGRSVRFMESKGSTRLFICMGVVKLDDNVPNWDTEAMAKGKDWRMV